MCNARAIPSSARGAAAGAAGTAPCRARRCARGWRSGCAAAGPSRSSCTAVAPPQPPPPAGGG
eukprot:1779368-Pyramimonas_sp.AAC.1